MNAPLRSHGLEVTAIVRRCAGKNRYPDEATARAAGLHYIEVGQSPELWFYRCQICNGYHLSSKDNGRKSNVKYGMNLPIKEIS
ncbi:hypothetical protein B0G76_2858 [Paraburkholderia sp. BL23I1N1]|uniref:hypothetical protein n=1 Tax=Paraburkholderia sp. BL23I1N1 TaxID=1938802 RepID=UPI000FF69514|nr:hypothetical protein [Paraburkholderia sp. BL23I1N1]RKE36656.1 hypothetical protein B0G76_2858 [Paraburkholderia sp. BL23I1N1]